MTITAAWNVKNEEKFIYYSILSVAPVVDEIIIVDHFSTDRTVEAIKSATRIINKNINIHSFDNNKDEVEAKNFKISKSTKEWILCMDGDEVYSKDNIRKMLYWLKQAEQQNKGGLRFQAYEFVTDMHTISTKINKNRPRLFLNNGKTKFVGIWGNDKVYSNDKFHIDDKNYWLDTNVFFCHYSRLKHTVEQRTAKIYKYLQSRKPNLTKEDIFNIYINNKSSKYYNEARNLIPTKLFDGEYPEVFDGVSL